MEGTVNYEGSGDVFFAFYNGAQQLTEMPKKDSNLGFEHAECSNGASVEWDSNKWAPKVLNITKTKTKCTLYFSVGAKNYSNVEDLMMNNPTMIDFDRTEDNNLRYIGASPKNYIDIGDRDSSGKPILWRIIGVMNNVPVVDDGNTTHQKSLVKIIRADSIGKWSWDSSASGVNEGYGVNEWSQADLMTTLNSEAYWSKTSGQCYNGSGDSQDHCDFSSTGLTDSVKDKLVKVRWNTGTMPDEFLSNMSKITASYMYEAERSNHNGKELCASSGGSWCNDDVERTTTWDGFIGLMYPSDYGYAVGGSVRSECLAKTIYNWSESTPDCKNNDWLRDSSNTQWTLTPAPRSSEADLVFDVASGGHVYNIIAYVALAVRPVAYLRSETQIIVGEGTIDNPHTLK